MSSKNKPAKDSAPSKFLNFEIAKLLINKGADINAESKLRNTPVHMAAKAGHTAVVKLLLEKGADWKLKNKMKETPLSAAKAIKNKAMIDAIEMHAEKNKGLFGF